MVDWFGILTRIPHNVSGIGAQAVLDNLPVQKVVHQLARDIATLGTTVHAIVSAERNRVVEVGEVHLPCVII